MESILQNLIVFAASLLPCAFMCAMFPRVASIRRGHIAALVAACTALLALLGAFAVGRGLPYPFAACLLCLPAAGGVLLCGRAAHQPPRSVLYLLFMPLNCTAFLLMMGGALLAPASGGLLWPAVLILALTAAVLALCAAFYKRYSGFMDETPRCDGIAAVRGIWLPAALCGAVILTLLFSRAPALAHAAALMCLAGTYLSYSLNSRLYDASARIKLNEEQADKLRRLMDMQETQYALMSAQFEEIRAARHDLRHHVTAMEQFVLDGDRERLSQYLSELKRLMPQANNPSVCANLAVDSVVRHYLDRAMDAGVEVDSVIELGENAGVPTSDLCIVFGNCLENAVEATQSLEKGGWIRIRLDNQPTMLVLVVGNSCPTAPPERDGVFLSSKRSGAGIGLSSIRAIAEKHGGTARFEWSGGVFKASVLLYKEDPCESPS